MTVRQLLRTVAVGSAAVVATGCIHVDVDLHVTDDGTADITAVAAVADDSGDGGPEGTWGRLLGGANPCTRGLVVPPVAGTVPVYGTDTAGRHTVTCRVDDVPYDRFADTDGVSHRIVRDGRRLTVTTRIGGVGRPGDVTGTVTVHGPGAVETTDASIVSARAVRHDHTGADGVTTTFTVGDPAGTHLRMLTFGFAVIVATFIAAARLASPASGPDRG